MVTSWTLIQCHNGLRLLVEQVSVFWLGRDMKYYGQKANYDSFQIWAQTIPPVSVCVWGFSQDVQLSFLSTWIRAGLWLALTNKLQGSDILTVIIGIDFKRPANFYICSLRATLSTVLATLLEKPQERERSPCSSLPRSQGCLWTNHGHYRQIPSWTHPQKWPHLIPCGAEELSNWAQPKM